MTICQTAAMVVPQVHLWHTNKVKCGSQITIVIIVNLVAQLKLSSWRLIVQHALTFRLIVLLVGAINGARTYLRVRLVIQAFS